MDKIILFQDRMSLEETLGFVKINRASEDDIKSIYRYFHFSEYHFLSDPKRIKLVTILGSLVGLSVKPKESKEARIILPHDELYIPYILLNTNVDLTQFHFYNAILFGELPEIETISHEKMIKIYNYVISSLT